MITENMAPKNVDVLHDTEWIVALGPTGIGKTTVMTYYLHWYLDRCADWIEAIYSVTPFFEGNVITGSVYPVEAESTQEYTDFGLKDGEWPAVEVEDPYFFYPDRPFEGKDGKVYYYPKLHHLLRPLGVLRNIENIRNCVFFGDELGNLIPARNYQDRRQWLIAKMAKDFRRHNVIFLATDQYNKAFDILLRQNFVNQVKPIPGPTVLTWEYYRSPNDPDFTNYRMHINFQVYPHELEGDDVGDYPEVPTGVVHRFFDSKHSVPVQFNEPLDAEKIVSEAADFSEFLTAENPFRVMERRDMIGELRMDLLDRALKDWNYKRERYWYGEELNSVLAEFVKNDGAEMNRVYAAAMEKKQLERKSKDDARIAAKLLEESQKSELRLVREARRAEMMLENRKALEDRRNSYFQCECGRKAAVEFQIKTHALASNHKYEKKRYE